MSNKEYDDEPVYYCTSCLSLRIKSIGITDDDDACYCEDCGSTSIEQTDIFTWQELISNRFINKNDQ